MAARAGNGTLRRDDGWRRSHRRQVTLVDNLGCSFLVLVDVLGLRSWVVGMLLLLFAPDYQDHCGCRQYGGLRRCFLLLLFVLDVCICDGSVYEYTGSCRG